MLDISRDPKRSFNCDESFVLLDPSKQQVVETKESKDVYFIHKTKPSSGVSVLATISTSGLILPPFIIYFNFALNITFYIKFGELPVIVTVWLSICLCGVLIQILILKLRTFICNDVFLSTKANSFFLSTLDFFVFLGRQDCSNSRSI